MTRPWRVTVVAATLLAAAAASVAAALFMARVSIRLTNPPYYLHAFSEPEPDAPRDPSAFGLDYHEVSFQTHDGSTIRGWLIPGPPGSSAAIVAAHPRAGDRRAFLAQVPFFHGLGLSVLLFDFREHGASDGAGRGMSLGYREAQDISAAVDFIKREAAVERVAVIGQSLGGSSAILAAAQDSSIDAVIADSSIASFNDYIYDMGEQAIADSRVLRGLPLPPRPSWWPAPVVSLTAARIGAPRITAPIDVIAQISPRPVLLIHGTADEAVDAAHSRALYDRASGPKELWIVPGGSHCRAFSEFPAEYTSRLSAFLRQSLLA
jgi:uncharacterized protein